MCYLSKSKSMSIETLNPTLASLEYVPYLNDAGALPEEIENKIGVITVS